MENINVLEEKENPLFKRKEIQLSVEAEITPSRQEVLKLLSEKFSSPTENIKIKKILGGFGSNTFKITANIYASEEDKEATEHKKKKEKVGEKKQEEEKPAKEEKPIEEVKEAKVGKEEVKEQEDDKGKVEEDTKKEVGEKIIEKSDKGEQNA